MNAISQERVVAAVVSATDELNAFLRGVELFRGVSDACIDTLISLIRHAEYRDGEVIFDEGAVGTSMCVIRRGRVKVIIHGQDVGIRLFEEDFFGEIALLDHGERTASLLAEGEVTVLHFSTANFKEVFRRHLDDGFKILENISWCQRERIVETNRRAVEEATKREKVERELQRLITDVAHAHDAKVLSALEEADWDAKLAAVIAAYAVPAPQAQRLLKAHGDSLRRTLRGVENPS